MSVFWKSAQRIVAVAAVGFFAVAFHVPAFAQDEGSTHLQQIAQKWLLKELPTVLAADGSALRMEAVVGDLDRRLKLAPCDKVQAYMPFGMRLWGRSQVGLRCIEGPVRWSVTMPVTINAYGPAWVVKGQVPAGAVLNDADVVQSEVNWSEDTTPVLGAREAWDGQVATRNLVTGQTLRQGMVKPAQVFQAGAPVRVVAQGAGFQISSDAQALSAGVVGQSARVRMDNGRVTMGVVLDGRTVKIDL
jgi:flagella basal body P-ring formation protein FlgA